MWRCLSDAAEDFLGGASQGVRRSSSWQPQRARVGKHKAELRVPQSLAKLLRTVRMMHELARNHSDRLAFKVHQRVLDHLGPEATPPKWSILDALPSMTQELQDAQDRCRVEQLQKWQAAMADDPARQRKWIQAATAVDPEQRLPHVTVQTAVHSQDKLAEAAKFWSNFWQTQPDSCATFEETMSGKRGQLLSFLNWVPPGGFECPLPKLTQEDLMQAAKKAEDKAPGPDQWRAGHLLRLPCLWWEQLADLWNFVIQIGSVPLRWTEVQNILLPNPTGGVRVLGIASIAWRLGASCIVKKLSGWTAEWAPPEIAGGLAGRGVHFCHHRFQHDLSTAADAGHELCVASEDLSKAFDTVEPCQSIAVTLALGLPTALAKMLYSFYQKGRRIFSVKGLVHSEWMRPSRSILQGCPFSPMILGAIMTLWWKHMSSQCSGLQATVFLDDRCYWLKSADESMLASQLLRAYRISKEFDAHFGFINNADKFQLAGTSAALCALLEDHKPLSVTGPVTQCIHTLGLRYDLDSGSFRTSLLKDNLVRAHRCLPRIRVAARSRRHRIMHISSLILPLFTWAATCTVIAEEALISLRRSLLFNVFGHGVRSASKFVMSVGHLGLQLDPVARAQFCVLKWLHARCRFRFCTPAWAEQVSLSFLFDNAQHWSPAVRHVLAQTGWTFDHVRGTFTRSVNQVDRVFHCGWDGLSTLRTWLLEHWQLTLFPKETRVWTNLSRRRNGQAGNTACGLDCLPPVARRRYFPQTHALLGECLDDNLDRMLSIMGGVDVWHAMPKAQVQRRACVCGLHEPSMAHLLWNCDAFASMRLEHDVRLPLDRAEERLLLTSLPLFPAPSSYQPGRYELEDSVLYALRNAWNDRVSEFVVATDGGSKHQAGSFGIVFADTNSIMNSRSIGGSLRNEDQGSFAAEAWAVFQAMSALQVFFAEHEWTGNILWLLDCHAVLSLLLQDSLSFTFFARHHAVRQILQQLNRRGITFDFCWVPSHGKDVPGWSPPVSLSQRDAQRINAEADQAASRALALVQQSARADWFEKRHAALTWQNKALVFAKKVGRRYLAHLDSHKNAEG